MNERRLSAFELTGPAVIGDGGCERLSGIEDGDWGCCCVYVEACTCAWEGSGNELGGCSRVVVVGLEVPLSATE